MNRGSRDAETYAYAIRLRSCSDLSCVEFGCTFRSSRKTAVYSALAEVRTHRWDATGQTTNLRVSRSREAFRDCVCYSISRGIRKHVKACYAFVFDHFECRKHVIHHACHVVLRRVCPLRWLKDHFPSDRFDSGGGEKLREIKCMAGYRKYTTDALSCSAVQPELRRLVIILNRDR